MSFDLDYLLAVHRGETPSPVAFNEEHHFYEWVETGQRMLRSVTSVVGHDLPPIVRQRIEETKEEWQPRGDAVHLYGEQSWRDGTQIPTEPFIEWKRGLFENQFIADLQPLAMEVPLCNRRLSIGGKFDFLGIDSTTGARVLLDLKSTKRVTRGVDERKTLDYQAQCGGYLSMLIDLYQVTVDECRIALVGPGETYVLPAFDPSECMEIWFQKWFEYNRLQTMDIEHEPKEG